MSIIRGNSFGVHTETHTISPEMIKTMIAKDLDVPITMVDVRFVIGTDNNDDLGGYTKHVLTSVVVTVTHP